MCHFSKGNKKKQHISCELEIEVRVNLEIYIVHNGPKSPFIRKKKIRHQASPETEES